MCLNPSKIPDAGFVACRVCWQCAARRVDDWVGRNIAEGKTAKAANVVTLTYGEDRSVGGIDHLRAAVLTYSDFQKYLKYLRVDGFPVRYFVVGEYGSKKGRAHWHAVLYWQDRVPDHELRKNFAEKHWVHGFSYWDDSSPEAVRYACKYLQKDVGDDARQGYGPMPSKKPPLGDAWFRRLAGRYVDAGISPQSLFYSFPEVRRSSDGKPVEFLMGGKTADNFCRYFVEGWRARYRDEPPRSEVIWAWLGKGLSAYLEANAELQFAQHRSYLAVPKESPAGGSAPVFDDAANCYWSEVGGRRLWYSRDGEGDAVWHEKVNPAGAVLRERELEAARLSRAYREATRGS